MKLTKNFHYFQLLNCLTAESYHSHKRKKQSIHYILFACLFFFIGVLCLQLIKPTVISPFLCVCVCMGLFWCCNTLFVKSMAPKKPKTKTKKIKIKRLCEIMFNPTQIIQNSYDVDETVGMLYDLKIIFLFFFAENTKQ